MASRYKEELIKNMQERLAYFRNANMSKEAELLQARLNSVEKKNIENTEVVSFKQTVFANPIVNTIRENLKACLAENIPNLEKQYILENANKATTLKELKPLRIACMERLIKINRTNKKEKTAFIPENKTETGPYNNEKTLNEALQLIYSQDPLWIEDLRELYFSIIPLSSAAAASKSPL